MLIFPGYTKMLGAHSIIKMVMSLDYPLKTDYSETSIGRRMSNECTIKEPKRD